MHQHYCYSAPSVKEGTEQKRMQGCCMAEYQEVNQLSITQNQTLKRVTLS